MLSGKNTGQSGNIWVKLGNKNNNQVTFGGDHAKHKQHSYHTGYVEKN